jgi:hypothetical protein
VPLPTFLIIGAQKSATRWLRLNLGAHPVVYTAPTELAFFNNRERFYSIGADGYAAMFDDATGKRVVGEATPGYMMWRHHPDVVAERIQGVIPDVRLLALLRNPIDRAQSAMVHHMQDGRLPPDARLLDLVTATPPERDPLGLVAGGWYAASLAPYFERFGDQLVVLLHDDVLRDPTAVYTRALSHIGAEPGFLPDDLAEIRHSRGSHRLGAPSPQERRELYEYFRDDVVLLATMLDRDLSAWDPDRADSAARESA